MNEINAINSVTDKGMELLHCVTMIDSAIKMLVTSPELQKRCLNVISHQATLIEQTFESYKISVIDAVKEITGENVDEINGISDNDGVQLY